MRIVFADTFFFLALLDTREDKHAQSQAALKDVQLSLVTTEWVLTEFGDAYCDPRDRPDFVAAYHALVQHPRVKIVPADTSLFQRGVAFFETRSDKKWSLTDCISFIVMGDEKLHEALTGDRDFEQAGFTALLR